MLAGDSNSPPPPQIIHERRLFSQVWPSDKNNVKAFYETLLPFLQSKPLGATQVCRAPPPPPAHPHAAP
jgi:hypothetical protein